MTPTPFEAALLYIWVAHFFADFICQTQWQAENKWNRVDALSMHVVIYSLILLVVSVQLIVLLDGKGRQAVLAWWAINAGMHFFIDLITSKISHHFFAKKDYHNGWVVVGADQLLHFLTIYFTLKYLFSFYA